MRIDVKWQLFLLRYKYLQFIDDNHLGLAKAEK